MADVSLVCMREDGYKADLLAGALERYGFSVCRSASVFEDFGGYAAVIVLLSPGAARSELVMGTAQRAMDWGKLIPVFVNLCRLPDKMAGVAMHDLSAWDGAEDDPVVQAIAYHLHRSAGLPGRPDLGPPAPRHVLPDQGAYRQPQIGYEPSPNWQPQEDYGYAAQHREPYFVATAYNQVEHYDSYGADEAYLPAIDEPVNVTPNEEPQYGYGYRPQRDYDRSYFQSATTIDHSYEDPAPAPVRRRPLPSIFTVLICAMALMGTAWFEEARTREVAQLTAKPAEATALLSDPSVADPGETPRKRVAGR
jgi:hypothetical protein